jgi:drug/metabolite transporter (DMT)-like permease
MGWETPSKFELFLFIILGLAGGIANLLLTQSYRLADASLVSPVKYLSLLFALFFGYYIWNEIPKPMMLFGAFLVAMSSLIIFRREAILKKQVVPPRA